MHKFQFCFVTARTQITLPALQPIHIPRIFTLSICHKSLDVSHSAYINPIKDTPKDGSRIHVCIKEIFTIPNYVALVFYLLCLLARVYTQAFGEHKTYTYTIHREHIRH